MMETCWTCGRYPGKYSCDGCGEDFGCYCGHCSRVVIVTFIRSAMFQRLCPICRMSGDNPMESGIYDPRFYDIEKIREYLEGR